MKTLEWIRDGDCIRCISHGSNYKGYPMITRNGIQNPIARHILRRRHGQLTPDRVSRHTCDHPWCIRPDHILIGSNADNVRDKVKRGRQYRPQGEKHPFTSLTNKQVFEIVNLRKEGMKFRVLAEVFGVSISAVNHIIHGRTWRHILG